MVNRAAVRPDSPLDADAGIAAESLTSWREDCLLLQRTDLDRALASFTFVADVTTLAADCRFAGDRKTLVARYNGLSFAAIAFRHRKSFVPGMSSILRDTTPLVSDRIATLTRRLVAPDEAFACLVAEDDLPLLRASYHVLDVYPEWQMLFHGDPSGLDPGDAVALGPSDVPEMRTLALREDMQAFDRDPLSRGPWYGVWRDNELVAQGGTHLVLDRAAEIGNIVTARAYRRRRYGSQVVAALLRELTAKGCLVFLHVLKENNGAIAFYERLGLERHRTMFLARCRVDRS